MERLFKGIRRFQESYFKKEEDFFKRLSKNQDPDVLFITCADSRVDPALVTQSKPGELFIVRNVGNIIPPFDALKDKNSVAAAIEFAVLSLKVSDVIVCGHSNCGAMQALYKEDAELDKMPHLKDWLKLAQPAKDAVAEYLPDSPRDAIQDLTEKANVLAQLENIQTYPFVSQALKDRALYLHGWHYEIGTGHMYAFVPATGKFEIIR